MNTTELNIKFSEEAYRAYYQNQTEIYQSQLKISFTDIMNGLVSVGIYSLISFSSSVTFSQLALADLRNCYFAYSRETLCE
jgi:hypothetical protein